MHPKPVLRVSVASLVTALIAVGSFVRAGCDSCGTAGTCPPSRNTSPGVYTPFGFFPKPPYKVWGNARPESVPAEGRVGIVSDCQAYEDYYGKPGKMSPGEVRRLRNQVWGLHTELRKAKSDIREAYGLNDKPVMAGRQTSPDDAPAPYAPSGPRAYAGTPDYHGPDYAGSFQVDGPGSWPTESRRVIPKPGSFTSRDVSHSVGHHVGPDASPEPN
jgi:hypothetical protein